MSKHYHDTRNRKKMLEHGGRNGIGAFRPKPKRQYKTCPRCGMHLDPGEVCDCMKTETEEQNNEEK